MTQPGQIVADRYRIISTLGNGQYGVVYRAEDVSLQKEVALKMLNVTDANSTALLRFQKEARAAAKLKHSNIVTVLDFRLDDQNNFYLVLELIQGMNLRSLIASHGRLAPDECMPLLLQILSGLAHAHENGVIHRDLNPNNILVDFRNPQQPTAKIVDFGLARLADEDQRLTREGVAVGTPEFMSPEQCHGTEIDARSDIYSFGCLMFDALTGNPPYMRDTVVDTIMCHINYDAPSLYDVCPDVNWPRHLPEIVAKSLNRDPNLRYQSADELAAALRSIPIETHAIELDVFEKEAVTKPPVVPSRQAEIARTVKNVPKSVILACLAIAALGSLLVVYVPSIFDKIFQSDSQEKAPVKKQKTPRMKARKGVNDAEDYGINLMINASDPDDPNELQKAITTPRLLVGKQPDSFDVVGCDSDEGLKIVANHKEIKSLRIQKAFLFTGTGLRFLNGLKLTHLQLRGSALTDANLAEYMPYMPTLTRVSLGGNPEITGKTFPQVAKKIPSLDFLDLSASGLTDDGLKEIVNFKKLRVLSFGKCPHVTGSTLSALAMLPNLRELSMINASKVDPANWSCLDTFPKLTVFDAHGCEFKPDNLRFLRNSTVTDLYLGETNLTDDGLKVISESPKVKLIWIPHAKNVTSKGIRHLKNRSVHELNGAGLPMTEDFINALCELKGLVVYNGASSGMTYSQAKRLLENSNIHVLYASAPITREDVINLHKQFPDRRIVHVPLDEGSKDKGFSEASQ